MVSSGESWLIVMYWRFMMITGRIYPLVISHSNWNWPFSSLFCLLDMVIFHNYVSVPGDTHLFCKVFDEGKTTFVIVKWTELEGSIARVRDSLKKYCYTFHWLHPHICLRRPFRRWFWRSQRQTPKCLAKIGIFCAGKATSWSSIFIFQQANTTSQRVRNCGSTFRYSIHHQQKKTIIFWVSFTSPDVPPCPTSSGEFPADRLPENCTRYCSDFLGWYPYVCGWCSPQCRHNPYWRNEKKRGIIPSSNMFLQYGDDIGSFAGRIPFKPTCLMVIPHSQKQVQSTWIGKAIKRINKIILNPSWIHLEPDLKS